MESAHDADRLQKLSKDLNLLTKEIMNVGEAIKRLEKSKESLRSQFFDCVNEYIAFSGTMETEVIHRKFASRAEAEKYVIDNHPGWNLIQYEEDKIVIEEDPAQMRFVWTTEDGYQISRTTAVVGTKFDYEYLMDHAPDLFREIVESKTVYELNEKKAQALIEKSPQYLSILQESTKLGKIQLRVSTPKKVVEE
jgi:hypothetical protein